MALTLNGTTGIAGIAGSAGTPALQGNNDTNTGYFFATDTLGLSTAGSERLRIGSNGELLTGGATTEPLYPSYTTARKVQAEIKGAIDVANTRHHGSLAINCTNENAALHR